MSQEKRIEYLLAQNRELVKELFRFDILLTITKVNLSKQQKALQLLVEIQKLIGFSRSDSELLQEVASLIDSKLEMAATYIYQPSEQQEEVYDLVSFHDTRADGTIEHEKLLTITRPDWPEPGKFIFINSKSEDCHGIEEIKTKSGLSSLIVYPLFHNECNRLIIITGLRVTNDTSHPDLMPEDLAAIEAVAVLITSYFRKTEFIQLYEADRFRTEFISNISHEFRTPLTLVLGLLEQIKSGMNPDNDSEILKSLEVVVNNALRLKQLIDQLLDLSSLETESERLRVACNSLDDLVTRIAQSFFAIARKSDIEFSFSVKCTAEESWYDEDKLEKILTNILDNAFKYTPANGRVGFSVSAERKGTGETYAIFVISDTGRGIPGSEHERIFERFYRSPNSGYNASSGTGIGLYLVRKMAALHHGTVEVDSQPGKGSAFTVRIPIDRSAYADSEMISEYVDRIPVPIPATLAAGSRNTRTANETNGEARYQILVAEDNRELNSFIAESLSKEFVVLEAFDGEEGYKTAVQHIPDLIVTDVMMPVKDGYDLCRRIRNNEKAAHIPVIMLTARADRQSTITGLECGADDYISKPFDMTELAIKIRNHLDTARRIRERYRKEFLTAPDESAIPVPDDTLVRKVIDLMRENLSNPDFHVNSVCTGLYISRTQLYRKLQALTGYSPAELIRSIRLKTAAAMFRKGHDNVAQVMYRVGFSNQSGFARHFRELYGVNPSEYCRRQTHR